MAVMILWQLLLGLGVFLYGMQQLESGLQGVSGARLNAWLMRFTNTPVRSTSFGVVITMVLQSSSMVSLLVLAFASAGIIPLYNGIGVLLGANLGTTATGWIVATIGFKLDLEALAIPLLGLGCLSQIFINSLSRLRSIGLMVLGVGLLLLGLGLMKTCVADLPQAWDLSHLSGRSSVVYLLVGVLVTALIQSSSATMILALTALNGQLIGLPEAAALIIGADIGTTSTTMLGSIGAGAIKKRLAMAHLIFNLSVDLAAFFLLLPLLPNLLGLLDISDPLYALVAFHSCFNLMGLLLFLPFLKHYSTWISRVFGTEDEKLTLSDRVPTEMPEAALTAMANAVYELWFSGLSNVIQHFDISTKHLLANEATPYLDHLLKQDDKEGAWLTQYKDIKNNENELVHFSMKIQEQKLTVDQSQQLAQLLDISRSLVYACKTLKDIHHDLTGLKTSKSTQTQELLANHRRFQKDYYRRITALLVENHADDFLQEEMAALTDENNQHHHEVDALLYSRAISMPHGDMMLPKSSDTQLSTQLNLNREIHHANKNLLKSIVYWPTIKTLMTSLAVNEKLPY